MKLLFDQNISFRIVKKVLDLFPESAQMRELGLENSKDLEIWEYASKNGYTVVTFDSDFYDLSIIKGIPPKIIWLRTGNTTTKNIEKMLLSKSEEIRDFIESKDLEEVACLEIMEKNL